MAKARDDTARLAELGRERDELERAIEEMIADMAELPLEQRNSGDWAGDGSLTRRYLDLVNRQAEIENDIATLSRDITASVKPGLPN